MLPAKCRKFLILNLIPPVKSILVLCVLVFDRLIADPTHQEPERIVVIFFDRRSTISLYTKIIKEHISPGGGVANKYIQISALGDGQSCI
jgi:hypothetical protein